MLRKAPGYLLILLICSLLRSDSGYAYEPRGQCLDIMTVSDTINPGSQDFIEYGIEQATADGARCLIIQLDTPGGLLTSMRRIVKAIMNAPLPIIVYVGPKGARAASAGVLITIAADIAAMAPGTNIGAAHPVTTTGGEVPKTMNEKVINDMVAFARSIASERGRNEEWVVKAIRESASITAEEAFALNVVDLIASDLNDLVSKLDGWEIERNGRKYTLHTSGIEQKVIEPTWRHKVLRALGDPNIAYILLMIGLAGLYFELSQPGVILPGVIGTISLILAFYSLQTLPVNYAGFLFILLAIVLFILEIKVISYGMLSLAGILSLTLGSLMLFGVPGRSTGLEMGVFIPTIATVSGFFVLVATLAFRAQTSKPRIGIELLVGMVGEAKTDLNPRGKVFVNGEIWNAEADEFIPSGARVEVTAVENLLLKIRRIDAN